jgi:hypothetical protein
MNEQQFGNKVRQILKQRPAPDPSIAERLRAARERALAHQRHEPQTALEWAHQAIGGLGGWSGVSLRLVAPLAVLVIGLSAIYAWQQNQKVAEMEEIDAMLLTDDLPIDAYLDRGFQNFVKTRAESE